MKNEKKSKKEKAATTITFMVLNLNYWHLKNWFLFRNAFLTAFLFTKQKVFRLVSNVWISKDMHCIKDLPCSYTWKDFFYGFEFCNFYFANNWVPCEKSIKKENENKFLPIRCGIDGKFIKISNLNFKKLDSSLRA